MPAAPIGGGWLFQLQRAGTHRTLLPRYLVTQLYLKLGRGGIRRKTPPVAINSSPLCGINLCLGRVGHHGELSVDCGLDRTLVDTGSTASLIHCGLLICANAARFAEADCGVLRIITVTREQAMMSEKRTVLVTMGNST